MKAMKIIKITAAAMLSLALALSAVSCQTGNNPSNESSTPSASQSSPEVTTPGATTPEESAPEESTPKEELTRPVIDYANMDLSIYITLGQYKDLEIPIPQKAVVDEAYVKGFLDSDLIYYGYSDKITDRAVTEDDTVSISYAGYLDGVAFEGGTGDKDNFTIYDGGGFIPGFAEGLIGATPGVLTDVNVTFPENYHSADLAGKAVVFKVTVHHIYEAKELTDEIANDMTGGEYKTAEDLLKYYNEYLTNMVDTEFEEKKFDLTWSTISEKSTVVSRPDDIINSLFDYEIAVAQESADQYGMDVDTLLSYQGYTRESLKAAIEESVIYNILIYSFIKAENFSITDDEYYQFIEDSGYTEEELLKSYTKEELRDTVKFVLAQERAVEYQNFIETDTEES